MNYKFSKDYEELYSLIMKGYKIITMTFSGSFVDDFHLDFKNKHTHFDYAELTKSFDSEVFDGFRLFDDKGKSTEGGSVIFSSHRACEKVTLKQSIKNKFLRICKESNLQFLPL